MTSIPIFDSLSHPTIDSNWILPKYEAAANIESLTEQMKQYNIVKSFAVGMKNLGSYDETKYITFIKPYSDFFIPIAFFDINNSITTAEIKEQLLEIKRKGYKGIKLHPRFSDFQIQNEHLITVISYANELELSVLFCTYFTHNTKNSCGNNLENFLNLLHKIQDCKIILLHGGTVRLLEFIEIARSFKNVLLDLSFTLCKYEGSSIDLDIAFACKTFDERICIGSDFPEFSMKKLRERFDFFTKDISQTKKENIGYKNIMNYL